MSSRKVDLGALRERITCPDVLIANGLDVPTATRRIACPIHHGDGLNFSVSRGGQRWRCWSNCGAGDIIDLAARLRACSTGDAIRWCADLAGIASTRPEDEPHRESRAIGRRRLRALRAWRSRTRMNLAALACDADRAADVARARLTVAGDDAEAWKAAAAAARAVDRIELLDWQLDAAADADLVEIYARQVRQ